MLWWTGTRCIKDLMKPSWLVASTPPRDGVLVLQKAAIFDVWFGQHKLIWHARARKLIMVGVSCCFQSSLSE